MMSRARSAVVVVLASLAALVFASGAEGAGAGKGPTVYLGLKRPEAAARAQFEAVTQPGSLGYRRFLSLGQVGQLYGAGPKTRRALRAAAEESGVSVAIDRSGVFARMTGPTGRLEKIIGTRIRRTYSDEEHAFYWFVPQPSQIHLRKPFASLVREVVPVFDRTGKPPLRVAGTSAARSAAAPAEPAKATGPTNTGTWLAGCPAAQKSGGYSPEQVREAYGIAPLGTGAGASVAIFQTGETVGKPEIEQGAKCFGLPSIPIRTQKTDGQARPFHPESPEPNLDLNMVRGIAPGLSAIALTQTWLEPKLWFLGTAKVLDAARVPDTFSISYGICEREIRGGTRVDRDSASLMDSLLLRLGLRGVGTFAAAGDFGSTCNGKPYPGVTWPASSPYVTAVGGTRLTLNADNERTEEVTWNDAPWLSHANGGGAGGGGLSSYSPRPTYQAAINMPGEKRAVPDISAHASMFPGWPILIGSEWQTDAGTSVSAPLLAGAFAVLSARERAAGQPPLGPVNGLLYYLERQDPAALFDVINGNNGYNPKAKPRQAGPGYDLASGLGVPRFGALANALPPPG
jgi:kumamolisin